MTLQRKITAHIHYTLSLCSVHELMSVSIDAHFPMQLDDMHCLWLLSRFLTTIDYKLLSNVIRYKTAPKQNAYGRMRNVTQQIHPVLKKLFPINKLGKINHKTVQTHNSHLGIL